MSDHNGSDMVGGFVLGALVGAGLALMLAPASGRDTRRRLGERVEGLKEMAEERFGEAKDTVRKGARHLADAVKEGADTVRRSADEVTTQTDRMR